MHDRTWIAALTGTAALAVAAAGWAQSTPTQTTTTGTTSSGATVAEDQATGTSTTGSPSTGSGQGSSDTAATTDSGTGNTNTNSPTGTTSRTPPASGTTTTTDTTPAAVGTSPTPAGTSGNTGTDTTTSSGAYGGTAGAAGTAGGTGRTASLQGTDATFLRKAMEGGFEEVQRAQAAMQNAQRAEVRNLASMMLEDHRRTNEKLSQLAQTKGWDVPSNASSSAAESDQSRMGTGAGFDDNYIEEEIRHHRETISLFRAQSSSGADPQLRQFAQDTLPALEHHLEMLQGAYSSK